MVVVRPTTTSSLLHHATEASSSPPHHEVSREGSSHALPTPPVAIRHHGFRRTGRVPAQLCPGGARRLGWLGAGRADVWAAVPVHERGAGLDARRSAGPGGLLP